MDGLPTVTYLEESFECCFSFTVCTTAIQYFFLEYCCQVRSFVHHLTRYICWQSPLTTYLCLNDDNCKLLGSLKVGGNYSVTVLSISIVTLTKLVRFKVKTANFFRFRSRSSLGICFCHFGLYVFKLPSKHCLCNLGQVPSGFGHVGFIY